MSAVQEQAYPFRMNERSFLPFHRQHLSDFCEYLPSLNLCTHMANKQILHFDCSPCKREGIYPLDQLQDVPWPTIDTLSDEFRMYEFKVRRCMRSRSHDWTECPFAHPGEKARRRDPRRVRYASVPCPDFRKGFCKRSDGCEFAHGVFECWLHPSRYRTQPCNDRENCKRRVCFFAHTPDQLRQPLSLQSGNLAPLPKSDIPVRLPGECEFAPGRNHSGASDCFGDDEFGFSSPTSTLLPFQYSPPRSPSQTLDYGINRFRYSQHNRFSDACMQLIEVGRLSRCSNDVDIAAGFQVQNGICTPPLDRGRSGSFWAIHEGVLESAAPLMPQLRGPILDVGSKETADHQLPDLAWITDLLN